MDTPYERIDPEVRREWLENPTTRAYLQTLQGQQRRIDTTILGIAREGRDDGMVLLGGQSRGLNFAVHLALGEVTSDVAR